MTTNHQEIANELDLFHFEEHSPGMIFWHPQGFKLFKRIEDFMREQHKKYGYKEIRTPMMLNKTLWEQSGHWEKFGDNIFIVPTDNEDKQTYALKPMSCPAHIQIYRKGVKSHKMLPDRYFEFGVVHRNEPSGALLGAMRLRQFTQDDAHTFCTEDQILGETENYINMLRETYEAFGYTDVTVKLATRPEERIGDDSSWDKAEKALEDACVELGLDYIMNPGEGAFYGPKLEFTLKDNLDRDWQCGTIQIDFNMTKRLDAVYIDKNGDKQNPVLIHHAVLGSLERWVAILLEQHNGELPLWLAPTQVVVATIVSAVDFYAGDVYKDLSEAGFEVELDTRNEKLGKKIKDAQKRKIPYMVIIGKNEMNDGVINVRALDGSQGNLGVDVFINDMYQKIDEKT